MKTGNLFRKKSIATILHDSSDQALQGTGMKRTLGVADLTALGVAAIVGAGIFSTVGNAAATGGPAVSLLFVFTAVACGLSAMCYAEFASSIPISGSAYTYAYTSFGELIAWIIGWDLIMEYAIGNIAVAISWSGYFTGLLEGFGLHLSSFLTTDYLTAFRGYHEAVLLIQNGSFQSNLSPALREAYQAWTTAPQIFNFRLIADIPAFIIVVAITWICYIGIRESKRANNVMVLLKIGVLLLVITAGAFYVDPANWSPFAPNGLPGVLKGVSGVFFAYIGFDAISTTAEECRNPKKDLPRSMFYALLITTILYVLVSLVLTGMVPYDQLGVADPLAFVFTQLHLTKLSGIIAVSAVVAMASVLLVFQLGQPRIWMSMSRDGLLPPIFARLHPKYRTPGFSTIITGVIVALPSLFMNLTEVTDLTSIGTLFAFILVSGGILIINPKGNKEGNRNGFVVPYLNSRYFFPPLIAVLLLIFLISGAGLPDFSQYPDTLSIHSLPYLLFGLTTVVIVILALVKSWSFIPALGLLTNFYLMSELGITNWARFGVWLVIGLLLYFSYGIFHSNLSESKEVVA